VIPRRRALFGAPLFAAAVGVALLLPPGSGRGGEAAPPLEEIRQALRELALEPPAEAWLQRLEGAQIERQLTAFDPYAQLLPPVGSAPEASPLRLGAELYRTQEGWWLLPFQGGPLEGAGIGERVLLEAVDGRPVAALSAAEVAALLGQAKAGRVALTLRRSGQTTSEGVKVRLAPFEGPSVEFVQTGEVGLLRVRRFAGRETRPFLAAADGPAGTPLVIDLRDALGGDLFEALDSAALFLPAGAHLADTRDRDGRVTSYRSPAGAKLTPPLLLLVGPDTASAAEIFAAILQYHGRALLVGRTTRGKCLSQTERHLSGGYRLRLTNLLVLPAGGEGCQGRGVVPDVGVAEETLFHTAELLELGRQALRERQPP
jgi:carboxyl-terminal processing protease